MKTVTQKEFSENASSIIQISRSTGEPFQIVDEGGVVRQQMFCSGGVTSDIDPYDAALLEKKIYKKLIGYIHRMSKNNSNTDYNKACGDVILHLDKLIDRL